MNFLDEILSSNAVNITEIHKRVPELKVKLDHLKNELVEYTDNVYIKHSTMGRFKQNRILFNSAEKLEKEFSKHKMLENANNEELTKTNNKVTEDLKSMLALDYELKIVSIFSKLNKKMEKFSLSLQNKQFIVCEKKLLDISEMLKDLDSEELLALREFEKTVYEEKSMLLHKAKQCFQDNVIIFNKDNLASIKILKENDILKQALIVLYNEFNISFINELTHFLWNNIFIPIVDNVVEVKVKSTNNYSIINRILVNSGNKSSYKEVFSQIKLVIVFLKDNFKFDLKDDKSITTIDCLSMNLRDNLSELIIKRCLTHTIPSTVKELENYKIVKDDTNNFESFLRDCKFFVSDTLSILEYANNIDFHFINKKCEEYKLGAEQIMKKDLHEMIEIGEPHDPNSFSFETEFPQCSVSKSAIELIQFCESILEQAVNSSNILAGRLLVTCYNILLRYTDAVPEYHSKLLKSIPQQVALFYNNCFYLAHSVLDINSKYITKISSNLNASTEFNIEKLTTTLKKAGNLLFQSYVNEQIKQINEIMNNSRLDLVPTNLQPLTEKSIRQCIRQQELLKTVWQKVLPNKIYNKTLGDILNSLCAYLIDSIVNFVDIPSKSAEQLVEMIKVVINRGPKLFTDPKEVYLYVKLWYKLNELNFVLGSSLLDINDRWADGKGPLAMQFKPLELKSLIRALFQNTDRRAALLNKIQD